MDSGSWWGEVPQAKSHQAGARDGGRAGSATGGLPCWQQPRQGLASGLL